MPESRRTTIIILIAAILILGVFSVIISLRLRQGNQAPTITGAGTCCSDWCNGSCPAGFQQAPSPCTFSTCTAGTVPCISNTDYNNKCGGGEGSSSVNSCVIQYPGGVTGCVSIASACGNVTADKYTRAVGPTQPDGHHTGNGDCVGTSTNHTTVTLGPGTTCPSNGAGCGQCVQYDIQNAGGSGGVAQYTGDCPVSSSSSSSSIPSSSSSSSSSSTPVMYACSSNQCVQDPNGTFTEPTCGGTCTISYPVVKYSCSNNQCVQDANGTFTESTCGGTCNTPPPAVCGGTCNTNADCPSNHTCSSQTKTCVLNTCLSNPSKCTANLCVLLPNTAIIDDRTDPFLFGLLAILLGVISLRFNLITSTFRYLWSFVDYDLKAELAQEKVKKTKVKEGRLIKKDRKAFESKFERTSD